MNHKWAWRKTRPAANLAWGLLLTVVALPSAAAPRAGDPIATTNDVACGQGGAALLCTRERWVAWHNGPGNRVDIATALGLSPDGGSLYVTGRSHGLSAPQDYATVAYDAATGLERWVARYTGPGGSTDAAEDLAVSADGAVVYVTGWSMGDGTGFDAATVAYDAATGAERWVARYNGPADTADYGVALGLSPDGTRIYVTGQSTGVGTGLDYAIVAYDAATGTEQWVARYDGPAGGRDIPRRLAVAPDGSAVYVTGWSESPAGDTDAATVAYDATTGTQRWVARYDGPAGGSDGGVDVAAQPDGTRVYVTGWSEGDGTGRNIVTIAYDATTGTQEWVTRFVGPVNDFDQAIAIGMSPNGKHLYVTGQSTGPGTERDIVTLAYKTADGREAWVERYDGPVGGMDVPRALAVAADGTHVYVTGQSTGLGPANTEYVTLAYKAADGREAWVERYGGPAGGYDGPFDIMVNTDGARVYVAGSIVGIGTGDDYATVAYDAERPWLPPLGRVTPG